MTVHQVEEYYLHIDIEKASKEAIEKATKHIEDEGYHGNYEVCEDYIVVDDLADESDAETLNDELNEILN